MTGSPWQLSKIKTNWLERSDEHDGGRESHPLTPWSPRRCPIPEAQHTPLHALDCVLAARRLLLLVPAPGLASTLVEPGPHLRRVQVRLVHKVAQLPFGALRQAALAQPGLLVFLFGGSSARGGTAFSPPPAPPSTRDSFFRSPSTGSDSRPPRVRPSRPRTGPAAGIPSARELALHLLELAPHPVFGPA